MGASLVVRGAREDDASAIADIHVRSWREAYRGLLPDELLDELSAERRERSWRDILAGRTRVSTTLVAEEPEAAVAGFCALAIAADEAEIAALYVEPGRFRRGIGSALLEAAMARAAMAGCRTALLWVLPENTPAIAFYARFGFAPDGGEKIEEPSGARVIRLRAPVPEERGG
ncbi:MAG: GNAT family N-acetyltransferase, partial [Actinomycetota bacterium]|nr:GNAT family N-acetyltransferase [Actinomycetota bacterium]